MLLSTRYLQCTSVSSLRSLLTYVNYPKSNIPTLNFSLAEMHLEGEEDRAAETVEETAGVGTVVVTTVMGVMVEAATEAVIVEDGAEAAMEVVMEAVTEVMGEAVMEEAAMEAGVATEVVVAAIKGQAELMSVLNNCTQPCPS